MFSKQDFLSQRAPIGFQVGMACFHIIVIALSNYLVQLPLTVFGWHTTWGALTFPLCYIASDFTMRLYGATYARRILWMIMLPALFFSYALSVLFDQGQWQGFGQLGVLDAFVGRIVIASFIAFVVGQLLDIFVFSTLRARYSLWWLAPAAASIFGNAIDSFIFFAGAFYQTSDPFMAIHWPEIACVDYVFKVIISVVLFVPLYGVLVKACMNLLGVDADAQRTQCQPS